MPKGRLLKRSLQWVLLLVVVYVFAITSTCGAPSSSELEFAEHLTQEPSNGGMVITFRMDAPISPNCVNAGANLPRGCRFNSGATTCAQLACELREGGGMDIQQMYDAADCEDVLRECERGGCFKREPAQAPAEVD